MRLVAALLLAGSVLVLAGCGETRECASGHVENYLAPVFNGKTTVLVPSTRFVCDEYAE